MRGTGGPAPYHDQRKRDAEVEERYSFPRDGESVLAYVSAHGDELLREFMAYCETAGGVKHEALVRFEVARFGDPLFEAAHGLLWHRVRVAMGWVKERSWPKREPMPEPKPEPARALPILQAHDPREFLIAPREDVPVASVAPVATVVEPAAGSISDEELI